MDFLDPQKKRAHNIRLYIGYALMAVAIGIGTIVLVFAAYGYDIDRNTGDVIQNGLVIVDAKPEQANIFIDGDNKGTTGNRLILPAGTYKLKLQRDGYRNWIHTLNLEGSSIEQLVYPFMFPTKLVTKTVQDYATAPSMASSSPDRHWLVVHQPNSPSSFSVVDLNAEKNPVTTITLPSDAFTPAVGAHTYEAIEWSTDNSHLLLKHVFTGGSEFIILNRDSPTSSTNINKVFAGRAFTSATLRDKKYDQLYLLNGADGGLFQADTKNQTATLIVSGVISYKSYEDKTLLYVTNPLADTKEVQLHVRQDKKDYLLRNLPIASTYMLDMAQFDGDFYLIGGSAADGHVYIYKNPFELLSREPSKATQPFHVLIVQGAQYVSFSTIARFVSVQGGSNFVVYDFETNRQFKYDTKLPLAANQKAYWMDGHRLSLTSDGAINIFDFDGTNLQKLSSSLPVFSVFFDRDYTAMFALAPNPDKTVLTRTELKVLPTDQTSQ